VSAECGHAFCRGCIGEYTASAVGAAKCPSCSEPLTINFSATTTVPLRFTARPHHAASLDNTLWRMLGNDANLQHDLSMFVLRGTFCVCPS